MKRMTVLLLHCIQGRVLLIRAWKARMSMHVPRAHGWCATSADGHYERRASKAYIHNEQEALHKGVKVRGHAERVLAQGASIM